MPPSWAADHRRLGNRQALAVEASEEVVDDPVRRHLAVAARGHRLEERRRIQIGGQDVGVVVGEAEVGHQAGLLRVRQFGHRGGDGIDPGLLDLQRQQVRVGEVAVVVRFLLGAHGCASRPVRDRRPRVS